MKKIEQLNSIEKWESFKNKSLGKNESIIFKFSPVCPISSSVEQMFDRWTSELDESMNIEIAKVDVIGARELSRYLASDLDIKHESPQLLWLDKEGNVKWHESHYDITQEELQSNLI